MELIIIRHGTTQGNLERRFVGMLDVPLAPEGEALAGSVAVAFGPRLSFVYGASSRRRPELAACYLLQWEMLRFALERGCDLYDMGGICTDEAESPALFHLYTFKRKFAPAEGLAGEFRFVF